MATPNNSAVVGAGAPNHPLNPAVHGPFPPFNTILPPELCRMTLQMVVPRDSTITVRRPRSNRLGTISRRRRHRRVFNMGGVGVVARALGFAHYAWVMYLNDNTFVFLSQRELHWAKVSLAYISRSWAAAHQLVLANELRSVRLHAHRGILSPTPVTFPLAVLPSDVKACFNFIAACPSLERLVWRVETWPHPSTIGTTCLQHLAIEARLHRHVGRFELLVGERPEPFPNDFFWRQVITFLRLHLER